MGDRSRNRAGQGNDRVPYESGKVRKRRATYGLPFLVGREGLVGLKRESNHWMSIYHRSELETCASCTQWLPKPSHLLQGHYAEIEFKHATSNLLGSTKHVYDHQNTACRTGTRLKKHCTTHVSSFVIRCTIVSVLLYAVLSKEAEVMVTVLTVQAAINVVGL
ncbi:hypothetical protein TNCV_3740721 [Trichonephila clavipes]|nr:hypothetical protein TNCV_3740721 [Trichonephila clavipes]